MRSAPPTSERGISRSVVTSELAPWCSAAALWVWAGTSWVWMLPLAAALVMLSVRERGVAGGAWRAAGISTLLLAIVAGFAAEGQIAEVSKDWDRYWNRRVDEVGVLLRGELAERRYRLGTEVVEELVRLWDSDAVDVDGDVVAQLRSRSRSSALALYDREGELLAWDGIHRGRVPEAAQRGQRLDLYRDLPLFGYLYVTATASDGSVAMAAYLLRASLPEGLGAEMGDLASRFYEETGERIRITEDDPGVAEAVWDLALDDDRLLSVVLAEPEPSDRLAVLRLRWALRVALLAALAWGLLAFGVRLSATQAVGAACAVTVAAAALPLGLWLPLAPGLTDGAYRVPGPIDLSAGRLALIVSSSFLLVPMIQGRRGRIPFWTPAALVCGLFPVILFWFERGLEPGLLAGGRGDWIAYEVAAAGLLTLVAGFAFSLARDGGGGRRWVFGGVGLAAAIAGGAGVWTGYQVDLPVAFSVLWALPALLIARGLHDWPGWQRNAVAWGCAAVLGSFGALSSAWGQGIEAHLSVGEQRLVDLAASEDWEVEDRLNDFARVADSLDRAGAEDVTILFEGWRRSGLADTGDPVRLQIEERDGSPGQGLRVGASDVEPQPYQDILAQGRRSGGVQLVQLNQDDARYILTVSLSDQRMLVAVAPPFPAASVRSVLGPLLRGAGDDAIGELSVMAIPEGQEIDSSIRRVRTADGWRVETELRYSTGPTYRARYTVELPQLPLAIARASLLTLFNVSLFLLLWFGGRGLLGGRAPERIPLSSLVISFRARVTLALFGFFALANALFGAVAFRTLNEASHRSAQVIAERVVDDAAGWYQALGGEVERLASQVGADLLEYRGGQLREGSLSELVDLGLYEGWTPYDVLQTLDAYEATRQSRESTLGQWEYVTVYRRLPDDDLLAAQIPLQAGTSALGATDLIELLAFVVLLGALLSLVLAMAAGRALTRPILALQIASESVGSGDLGLRLPASRSDEFGAVFRAFNRMVGRVRRARRQLLRTSRRTQLIMDEAAVGMVALDAARRVTLVNPRAEELLGSEVPVGRLLPGSGTLGDAFVIWLDDYLEGSADEASSDFEVSERRIRVRARRLGSRGSRRGVVITLDDVTDELRAERVLAWGEMARQVAHEVKNPLTPIKLSIQHVRRAWDDDHPEFEDILVRNADAMLLEIDRLAQIAQSFSRFGAPGAQDVPLSSVGLGDVVEEVMVLYGGATSRLRFVHDLEPDLPMVVARTAELKEVLVNLLENARLAGEEGTSVVVSGRKGVLPGTVVLRVTDDGAGIAEDVLPRIFEPQFSTRSTGSGLGLAIVQRVVRAWGGSVEVASQVGQGTTVTVTLRVAEGVEEDGATEGAPPASSRSVPRRDDGR